MIQISQGAEKPGANALFDAMYRDRKRVFVDLRRWAIPVLDDMYEVDQFDGPNTVYCIATDHAGNHRGSIRILPTDEPHILGDLFPELCEGVVPTGKDIRELTRACLSPAIAAAERKSVRNALTTAVVEYALRRGICSYTCIADSGWLSQILALGWDCAPLGLPRRLDRTVTGALRIAITPQTPELLRKAGTYEPSALEIFDHLELSSC